MDRCVFPVPTPPTNTTLEASATKRQSKTCRTASRSRSGCASNEKASSVFSIGKRASWMGVGCGAPGVRSPPGASTAPGSRAGAWRLAGGLLGQQRPTTPRSSTGTASFRSAARMRGLGNYGGHQQEPSTSASYADSVGVGTAISAPARDARLRPAGTPAAGAGLLLTEDEPHPSPGAANGARVSSPRSCTCRRATRRRCGRSCRRRRRRPSSRSSPVPLPVHRASHASTSGDVRSIVTNAAPSSVLGGRVKSGH